MTPLDEILSVIDGDSEGCVVCGDSPAIVALLPRASIPMVFADPPYGHGNHDGDLNAGLNELRGIDSKPIANDSQGNMRRVVSAVLLEAAKFMDPDCCCCCCCCGGGPRPTFAWLARRMDRKGLAFFHSVIWDKRNPGLGWRFRRQHEMVMVAHRTKGRLRWSSDTLALPNIFSCYPPRKRFHPNEKPVALCEYFIAAGSLPGDIILDPFCGSGTTCVAAKKLGRRWIGIDIEPKYVKIAKNRLRDTPRNLFAAADLAARGIDHA